MITLVFVNYGKKVKERKNVVFMLFYFLLGSCKKKECEYLHGYPRPRFQAEITKSLMDQYSDLLKNPLENFEILSEDLTFWFVCFCIFCAYFIF